MNDSRTIIVSLSEKLESGAGEEGGTVVAADTLGLGSVLPSAHSVSHDHAI